MVLRAGDPKTRVAMFSLLEVPVACVREEAM